MLSATGYSQVLEEFVNDYAPDGGDGSTSGGGSLWTSSLGLCPIDDHWPPGITPGITPETAPETAPGTTPGTAPGSASDLYRSYLIGLQALGQSFAPGYESAGIDTSGIGGPVIRFGGLSYNLLDGHGSVQMLLSAQGVPLKLPVFKYDDATGKLLKEPNYFRYLDTTITALGYAGEYRDARTGLIYLRDRWMNPATGRFTQADRFRRGAGADLLGANIYTYGNNSPANGIDPTGLAFFAFDGTNNYPGEVDQGVWAPTNIYLMYLMSQDPNAYYFGGPGNPVDGDWMERSFGGMTGLGMDRILRLARKRLSAARASGDHVVDIIGFSRGGVIATEFANQVATDFPDMQIRFVGLFDPVSSVGLPHRIGGYRPYLPPNVSHAYEALALDEDRWAFPVNIVPGASQKWFHGVHSDIGGGFANHGLSDVTLLWMVQNAQSSGVAINLSNPNFANSGFSLAPNTSQTPNVNTGASSWISAYRPRNSYVAFPAKISLYDAANQYIMARALAYPSFGVF